MRNTEYIELQQFKRNGNLTKGKLINFIPMMIITNLSFLMITTVDGLVVGNYVGAEAFSSVNIFYPVTLFINVVSMITTIGVATSVSTAMGRNDVADIDRIKGASVRLMLIMAAVAGLVQIPVVWLLIRSYGLSPELYDLTWQYAAGIMICTPFSLISSVSSLQLQVAGKMKVLMGLSVMESVVHFLLDLLLVGSFHMGVAGAGYGTALSNVLRCSVSLIYILRRTQLFKSNYRKLTAADAKEILILGLPDASFSLVLALSNFYMMRILLSVFGTDGGVIRGVGMFCFNLAYVLMGAVTSGARPLMGLFAGAGDKWGLRILMRQAILLDILLIGLITVIFELKPVWFYKLHGVDNIPEYGIVCVRIFVLYFVIKGLNYLFRMYLSNRKDAKYSTVLTVIGNATLPVFAYILCKLAPAPYVFFAYLATELLVLALYLFRYRYWVTTDSKEMENSKDIVLYMTVKPDEAVEASRVLRQFALERGIGKRIAYRAAVCMEEMVAYVREPEHRDLMNTMAMDIGLEDKGISVDIMIRFKGPDDAIFITLDDSACIALDSNKRTQKIITDNYGLLRKISKSVEYQYLLNMNYTRITL